MAMANKGRDASADLAGSQGWRDELAGHPLFGAFPAGTLARLLARADALTLPGGVTVVGQGEQARHFILVRSGRLKLYRLAADQQEKVFAIVESGQVFADGSLFLGQGVHALAAATLARSTLARFPRQAMLDALAESPRACLCLLSCQTTRLQQWLAELDLLTEPNASHRVVLFLRRLAGEDARPGIELRLPLPKRLIAARLAMQPETLSRVIARLQQDGLLRVRGGQLCLPDPAALWGLLGQPGAKVD